MRLYRSRRSGFARAAIAACVALLLAAALLVPPQQHARPAAADTPAATPLTPSLLLRRAAVPTTAECVRAGLGPCYTPAQIRAAYNIQPLIDAGIDGSGQTIVIIDSFGSEGSIASSARVIACSSSAISSGEGVCAPSWVLMYSVPSG